VILFANLKKIGVIVRFLQLATIAVICQYYTVFSLPLMLWLFITSLTYSLDGIYYVTMLLGLPASIAKAYSVYYADLSNGGNIVSWLGRITVNSYWIEHAVTFTLLILFCNFIKMVKNARRREGNSKNLGMSDADVRAESDTFGGLLVAIILKNAYFFSLAAIYIIGTTKVSIFNLVLVSLSTVFLISDRVAKKSWIMLFLSIMAVITSRYIWLMGWFSIGKDDPIVQSLSDTLKFVGLVDVEDDILVTGGMTDQNLFTNILFWAMFFSALLQYDVYRSRIIQAHNAVRFMNFLNHSQIIHRQLSISCKDQSLFRMHFQILIFLCIISTVCATKV